MDDDSFDMVVIPKTVLASSIVFLLPRSFFFFLRTFAEFFFLLFCTVGDVTHGIVTRSPCKVKYAWRKIIHHKDVVVCTKEEKKEVIMYGNSKTVARELPLLPLPLPPQPPPLVLVVVVVVVIVLLVLLVLEY